MRLRSPLIALLLTLIPLTAQAFDARAFYAEVLRHGARYTEFSESAEARGLMEAGELAALNQRLLQLVPDEKKTAYDYFSLGNMLFSLDDALSLEMMRKAEAAWPDNPAVLLEVGMLEHRRGRCDAALPYYERFLDNKMGKQHTAAWTYATDCYLRAGQADKAIKTWRHVDFREHHIAIEKGMHSIYGGPRPELERAQLLGRIRAGEHEQFCRLLRLDRNWVTDWWNVGEHKAYLAADQALADRLLVKDAAARDRLALCTNMATLTDTDFLARMEALGFWGNQKKLPASPELAYLGIERLIKSKLASDQQILAAFEGQLQQALHEHPQEQKYLDLLAYLYSHLDQKEKLEKVDLMGWHQLHLENYATSYLAGRNPGDADFDALLAEALRDFPNSDTLNKFNLKQNLNGPGKQKALNAFMASRFALVGKVDSYSLGDYMASFEHMSR